jgi:hypothetical protein
MWTCAQNVTASEHLIDEVVNGEKTKVDGITFCSYTRAVYRVTFETCTQLIGHGVCYSQREHGGRNSGEHYTIHRNVRLSMHACARKGQLTCTRGNVRVLPNAFRLLIPLRVLVLGLTYFGVRNLPAHANTGGIGWQLRYSNGIVYRISVQKPVWCLGCIFSNSKT